MQVVGLPGQIIRNGRAASRLLAAQTPSIEAARRRDAVARWRRARADGYDEALLVRSDGVVLEGPTCSIFWVRDGRLRTPALETGILASITRRVILESLGAEEGSFALKDAVGADEAFLASTARWAQPIASIGETSLPAAPGPQTLAAQEAIERAMAEGSIA